MKVKSLSRVRLFETPGTAAYQAPPSMGFSGQEYQSGLPFLEVQTLKLSGHKVSFKGGILNIVYLEIPLSVLQGLQIILSTLSTQVIYETSAMSNGSHSLSGAFKCLGQN